MSRRGRWTAAGVFLCAYCVVSLTIPRGYLLTTLGDITQCSLLLCLLVICLRNWFTSESRTKAFWGLVALGCGLWLTSQSLWTIFEVVLRKEVPNPFIGDVFLVLHLIPMMGALALQPHVERDEQTAKLGALDFVLLISWWLFLYIFLVAPWQYVSPNAASYGSGFDVAYCLAHCVFLVCVVVTWLRSGGAWKSVYKQLLAAGMIYFFGSMAASVAIDFGEYYTGGYFDLPIVLSMLWFIEFALVGGREPLRPSARNAAHERLGVWVSGMAMTTILSLPVLGGWALYFSHTPLAVRDFRVLATLSTILLMSALVWIKQHRTDQELARRNHELRDDSLTDPLTKCRNRRFVESILEPDVEHVLRSYSHDCPKSQENQDLIFYLIDCDNFKEINDRCGHNVGDQVLIEIARRISSAIRHSDVLIRWGGDEFMVVSRYSNRADAHTLAMRILNSLGSTPFEIGNVPAVRCTGSIGWAVFPWFTTDPRFISPQEIVRLSDAALYEAKQAGRNRAVGILPIFNTRPDTLRSIHNVSIEKLLESLNHTRVVTEGPSEATHSEFLAFEQREALTT